MKYGIVSPEENESIPMIKLIIEKVLSDPGKYNEVACISSPANPIDSDIKCALPQENR